jgi:uncharacterized RDD family membrane protein YckC
MIKIDFNSRIVSARLDLKAITPVVFIFGIPDVIYHISEGKTPLNHTVHFSFDGGLVYILCIGLAIFYCKDCINGQSPGKKVLKWQVINVRNRQIANPLRCLVRDLFIILIPVEIIMLLIDPTRRLGDYVAGTQLAPFNPELKLGKISYLEIGISFFISYVFVTIQVLLK